MGVLRGGSTGGAAALSRSPPCRDQLVNIVEMEGKLEAQAQDGRRQGDDFPVLKSTKKMMVKAESCLLELNRARSFQRRTNESECEFLFWTTNQLIYSEDLLQR